MQTNQANAAPSFSTPLANQNFLSVAQDFDYTLPRINDPGSTSPTITLGTGLPSYIEFIQPNVVRIKP